MAQCLALMLSCADNENLCSLSCSCCLKTKKAQRWDKLGEEYYHWSFVCQNVFLETIVKLQSLQPMRDRIKVIKLSYSSDKPSRIALIWSSVVINQRTNSSEGVNNLFVIKKIHTNWTNPLWSPQLNL